MTKTKLAILIALFASCEFYGGYTSAQTPQLPIMETAARFIRVNTGTVEYEMNWGVNVAEVNSLTWYMYVNASPRVEVSVKCSGSVAPFSCIVVLPELRFGNNIIQVTAARSGVESDKSLPLVIYYAWSEPPPPVPDPPIQLDIKTMLCIPGTFRVQRITDATKLLAAYNSAIGRVAFSYATSNAVYVVSCDMEGQNVSN